MPVPIVIFMIQLCMVRELRIAGFVTVTGLQSRNAAAMGFLFESSGCKMLKVRATIPPPFPHMLYNIAGHAAVPSLLNR